MQGSKIYDLNEEVDATLLRTMSGIILCMRSLRLSEDNLNEEVDATLLRTMSGISLCMRSLRLSEELDVCVLNPNGLKFDKIIKLCLR